MKRSLKSNAASPHRKEPQFPAWPPTTETLHSVILKDDTENVMHLLEQGANIEELNYEGLTPLNYAVSLCRADITKLLIENGAKIDTSDRQSHTPLHFAIIQGNIDIAKLLIANGANVNHPGYCGFTPLVQASLADHAEAVLLLVSHGAETSVLSDAYKQQNAKLISAGLEVYRAREQKIINIAEGIIMDTVGNSPGVAWIISSYYDVLGSDIPLQAQRDEREKLSQSTYRALKNVANGTPDRWQRAMFDAATPNFPVVVYSPRPAVTFSADSSSATPKRDRAEAPSAEGCSNKKAKISEHNNKPGTKSQQEEQPEAIRRNSKRTCRK